MTFDDARLSVKLYGADNAEGPSADSEDDNECCVDSDGRVCRTLQPTENQKKEMGGQSNQKSDPAGSGRSNRPPAHVIERLRDGVSFTKVNRGDYHWFEPAVRAFVDAFSQPVIQLPHFQEFIRLSA